MDTDWEGLYKKLHTTLDRVMEDTEVRDSEAAMDIQDYELLNDLLDEGQKTLDTDG